MHRFIEPVGLLLFEFGRIRVNLNELTVFKSVCFQSKPHRVCSHLNVVKGQ